MATFQTKKEIREKIAAIEKYQKDNNCNCNETLKQTLIQKLHDMEKR